MIKNYSFSNFHSYLDETFIDLSVSNKTPHSYFDYELSNGSKISKIMGVFGANGSGKSNLLKPIAFVSWFLTHSFKALDKNEEIPLFPHFAANDKPTSIEVEFVVPSTTVKTEEGEIEEVEDIEMKYSLSLTDKYVISEELKYKSHETNLYRRVFSRIREGDGSYTYKKSSYITAKLTEFVGCPENCSLVSYFGRLEEHTIKAPLIMLTYVFFRLNTSNLTVGGRINDIDFDAATDMFVAEPDIFKKVIDLIRDYDLGIKDIVIEEKIILNEETNKKESRKLPFFVHEHDGKDYEVPIWLESSGTQTAYFMLAQIMDKLQKGGVAILDEFDNDLHPLLTLEILELFKCESNNVSNAQLIFTSHTPQVLSVLRKQHCFLVEKHDSMSDVWRIDQIEGIKERDNLYTKYINGILGGVPEF